MFFFLFQKKPRPTRSLASRLSGYKTPKRRQSEISDLGDCPNSEISSEPVKDDVTNPAMSDAARIVQSEPEMSESSVVLILEPLVLESPMNSQPEIGEFHNVLETGQSEINKSFNIAETGQSELSEFVNTAAVQSELNQSLDLVLTSQ